MICTRCGLDSPAYTYISGKYYCVPCYNLLIQEKKYGVGPFSMKAKATKKEEKDDSTK